MMQLNQPKFSKKRFWILSGSIFLSLLVLQSCIDKDDYAFNRIAGFKWNPDLALPLVDSKLGLENFIADLDSDLMSTDEEGLISFVFQEDLLSYELSDLIDIPSSTIEGEIDLDENIPIPPLDNQMNITLGDLTGWTGSGGFFPPVPPQPTLNFDLPPFQNVIEMQCSQGNLNIAVSNGFSADVSFVLRLRNKEGGATVGQAINYSVPAGGLVDHDLSLAGETIRGEVMLEISNLSSPGSAQGWDAADELGFTIQSSNITIDRATITLEEDVVIDEVLEIISFDLDDEQIESILFSAGNINISFQGTQMGEILFELPDFSLNGQHFTLPINLAMTHSANGSIASYTANLTRHTPAYNNFSFRITGRISSAEPVTFTPNESVQYTAVIGGLEFQTIRGFFGNKTIELPETRSAIDGFNNAFKGTDLSVKDATFELVIVNGSGIPVGLDFTEVVVAKNNGTQTMNLSIGNTNPVIINAQATENGSPAITTIPVNNVSEVMGFGPEEFIYKINAFANPQGGNVTNFLSDQSKLEVSLNMDIPFYVKFSDLGFKDTVALTFDGKIDVTVEKALLKTYITNEFPLDAYIQLYYTDKDYNVIGQIFMEERVKVFASSQVDANGKVVQPVVYDELIELNSNALKDLLNASYLIIDAKINTGGNDHVRLNTNHTIDVKVGLQTKFRMNDK